MEPSLYFSYQLGFTASYIDAKICILYALQLISFSSSNHVIVETKAKKYYILLKLKRNTKNICFAFPTLAHILEEKKQKWKFSKIFLKFTGASIFRDSTFVNQWLKTFKYLDKIEFFFFLVEERGAGGCLFNYL